MTKLLSEAVLIPISDIEKNTTNEFKTSHSPYFSLPQNVINIGTEINWKIEVQKVEIAFAERLFRLLFIF